MTKKKEIPSVSGSNTKKELLEAYEAMKSILETQQKELLNAEKAREQADKQAAQALAEKVANEDPIRQIHDLRVTLGKELSGLAERFEVEIETFRKVSTAVEDKQRELKNLYEIEAAASDLAALLGAQEECKRQFNAQMEEEKSAFEQEKAEKQAAWEKEKELTEAELADEKEKMERRRQREDEEYQYQLKRDHEQKANKLRDELQELEREITVKRESHEQEVKRRTEEIDQREGLVNEREKFMDELNAQVNSFPTEKEKEVSMAVEAAITQLQEKVDADKSLMKAHFDGEKRVLESKVASMEQQVESLQGQIDNLLKKQEKAYEQVQNIANRAVSGASERPQNITVKSAKNNSEDS